MSHPLTLIALAQAYVDHDCAIPYEALQIRPRSIFERWIQDRLREIDTQDPSPEALPYAKDAIRELITAALLCGASEQSGMVA